MDSKKLLKTRSQGLVSTALALLFGLLLSPEARADQSSLNLGYMTFGGGGSQIYESATGWAMNFVSETSGNFIRPSIGVQLESSSGTLSDTTPVSITAGSLMGGFHFFFFKTAYVRPFLATDVLLGWGSMTYDTDLKAIGLNYGMSIGGGAELRFKNDPKGKALRITSSYRWYQSTFSVGSLSGFDFSAILFGLGFSF